MEDTIVRRYWEKVILKKHPNAQIKYKGDVWWWRLLGWMFPALKDNYTVVGFTLYVPFRNFLEKHGVHYLTILAHEETHFDQMRWGRFVGDEPLSANTWRAKLWPLLFALPYLALPFPVKWALFRLRSETEAFSVGRAAMHILEVDDWHDYESIFAGPSYLWTTTKAGAEAAKTEIEDWSRSEELRNHWKKTYHELSIL